LRYSGGVRQQADGCHEPSHHRPRPLTIAMTYKDQIQGPRARSKTRTLSFIDAIEHALARKSDGMNRPDQTPQPQRVLNPPHRSSAFP
jgi:hypothetical protein